MSTADTVYKLYKCGRCYGDNTLRRTIKPEWVMDSRNMQDLVNHITSSTETDKTFCIEKYIDWDQRWRRLGVFTYNGRLCSADEGSPDSGDLTTTWEKYIWSPTTHKWRITNYRYDDELVERSPYITYLQEAARR